MYIVAFHAAEKTRRRVSSIKVGGRVITEPEKCNISVLMSEKAMPIERVNFRGFFRRSIGPDHVHSEPPITKYETLGETLEKRKHHSNHANGGKRTATRKEPDLNSRRKAVNQGMCDSSFGKNERASDRSIGNQKVVEESSFCQDERLSDDSSSDGSSRFQTVTDELTPGAFKLSPCLRLHKDRVGKEVENSAPCANKSVHFGEVRIREYSRCLGDNPACSHGPALSLGWRYRQEYITTVDEFEESKFPRRQDQKEFKMSSNDRKEILLNLGYSFLELSKAEREKQRIQCKREETIRKLKYFLLREKVLDVFCCR